MPSFCGPGMGREETRSLTQSLQQRVRAMALSLRLVVGRVSWLEAARWRCERKGGGGNGPGGTSQARWRRASAPYDRAPWSRSAGREARESARLRVGEGGTRTRRRRMPWSTWRGGAGGAAGQAARQPAPHRVSCLIQLAGPGLWESEVGRQGRSHTTSTANASLSGLRWSSSKHYYVESAMNVATVHALSDYQQLTRNKTFVQGTRTVC